MRRFFTIQILFLTILLTACGGGGGSSSSTGTSSSNYKFKTEDLDATVGRWFTTSFVVNGEETMPTFFSKIQMDIDSDGEWTTQMEVIDVNGNVTTQVVTSGNEGGNDYEILSFSYLINEEGSIQLTEKFKVKETGEEQTVSTIIIKDEVISKYIGNYYLSSATYGGVPFNTSNISDILKIDSNGTITEITSAIDGSNKITVIGHCAVQDGHVFIDYTTLDNIVGEASLSGNTLSFLGKKSNGDTYTSTWSKITGGELTGKYILKSFSYQDTLGLSISTSNVGVVANGDIAVSSDGKFEGGYNVFNNGAVLLTQTYDNFTYEVSGETLTITNALGQIFPQLQFEWDGTELITTESGTVDAGTYVGTYTWQKTSDE